MRRQQAEAAVGVFHMQAVDKQLVTSVRQQPVMCHLVQQLSSLIVTKLVHDLHPLRVDRQLTFVFFCLCCRLAALAAHNALNPHPCRFPSGPPTLHATATATFGCAALRCRLRPRTAPMHYVVSTTGLSIGTTTVERTTSSTSPPWRLLSSGRWREPA